MDVAGSVSGISEGDILEVMIEAHAGETQPADSAIVYDSTQTVPVTFTCTGATLTYSCKANGYSAVNSSVPAIAPADFQAGLLFGYYGQDVKADMEACFGEDQTLADETDTIIQDIENKDWANIQAEIKKFTADVKPRVDNCDDKSPVINSMYHNEEDTVKAVKNDPDWQLKILRIVMQSKADITTGVSAALTKWNSGDYYGAGEELGKIEKIVSAPWFIPLNEATSFLQ